MTREELYERQSQLKEQIRTLKNELSSIASEIVETFPFKVGDKIRYRQEEELWRHADEGEAWILKIQLNEYDKDCVTLTVNFPRKDGSRSSRKNYIHGIYVKNIEVIEKNS